MHYPLCNVRFLFLPHTLSNPTAIYDLIRSKHIRVSYTSTYMECGFFMIEFAFAKSLSKPVRVPFHPLFVFLVFRLHPPA